jgi:putative PIN family toxin of toxin-antitoxin system
MVDANIIISAILFPNSIVAKAFNQLIENYDLVLSKYTLFEIEDVFNEKFSHRMMEMKEFMQKTPYELFENNKRKNKAYPNIRDIDDLPVLINAIESKVDIFITGDKDFDDILIKNPRIINQENILTNI